jgi:hypothetical protein
MSKYISFTKLKHLIFLKERVKYKMFLVEILCTGEHIVINMEDFIIFLVEILSIF